MRAWSGMALAGALVAIPLGATADGGVEPGLGAALAAILPGAVATGGIELNVGAEYTKGKYGNAEATEIWYYPVTLRYRSERVTLGLMVPYIHTTGSATVGDRTSLDARPGDIEASGSYLVHDGSTDGWFVEMVGKAKFPTGDPAKGLGTGSRDYTLEGQFVHQGQTLTSFGNVGWRHMGNAGGGVLKSAWHTLLGAGYDLSASSQLGAAWNYRQPVAEGAPPVRELMVYLTLAVAPKAKLQGYLLKGYSDGSPDKGVGLTWNGSF
ncbi:MAG: hypothetical protein HY777_05345 [Betaproteobacteria bacterium]|nr:hypothetical protein [Betaproteobacteria bacterium]